MEIIADENVDFRIFHQLRKEGFSIEHISMLTISSMFSPFLDITHYFLCSYVIKYKTPKLEYPFSTNSR